MCPLAVAPALVKFNAEVLTSGKAPWPALLSSFGRDHDALRHSPVVLMWKERGQDGAVNVRSRALTLSVRETRCWGVDLACPGPGCKGSPGDIRTRAVGGANHARAKFYCLKCSWQSDWFKRPEEVKPLKEQDFVFWHEFPRQWLSLQRSADPLSRVNRSPPRM